jgi:hypothetical protein
VVDGLEQVNLAGPESDLVIGHYADAGSAGQSFFVFGGQWARQWKKMILELALLQTCDSIINENWSRILIHRLGLFTGDAATLMVTLVDKKIRRVFPI